MRQSNLIIFYIAYEKIEYMDIHKMDFISAPRYLVSTTVQMTNSGLYKTRLERKNRKIHLELTLACIGQRAPVLREPLVTQELRHWGAALGILSLTEVRKVRLEGLLDFWK